MVKHELDKESALKLYALRFVDSIYNASVFSVIAYSLSLLLLAMVGLGVYFKLIYVPEFHPW
ncbi:hypothetical protein V3H18_02860 [Methylocystis sp. 9N]|uniref:Uncharacterized protein n=1 Tax=Methylocystis borbori TaxID=3118750 RepID=A0ABU7XE88_9HYPH